MRVPNKSKERLARQRAGVMDDRQLEMPRALVRKLGGGASTRGRFLLRKQRRQLEISRFEEGRDDYAAKQAKRIHRDASRQTIRIERHGIA